MRRRPPSPRASTRSLPWYALAALITVTLYWNFDAHVEAHGEPGVDLMARQEIARITERVRMLEDLGVSGLRSLRTKTERDPEKEQAPRGDLLPESATAPVGGGAAWFLCGPRRTPGVSAPVITPVIDSQEYSYVKKSNGLLPDRGSSCIKSRSGLRTQTIPCDGATNGGHGSSHACISS